jgi:predicted esterase
VLFVLLHGHNSSPAALHDAAVALAAGGFGETVSPTGFCHLTHGRSAWWDEGGDIAGPEVATGRLRALVSAELKQRQIGWDDVIVVGFSQGGALALALCCDGGATPSVATPWAAAIVAGFVPDGTVMGTARMRELLVIHGEGDEIVDCAYGDLIARQARRAGAAVAHVRHGGGHAWVPECTEALVGWVKAIVDPRYDAEGA